MKISRSTLITKVHLIISVIVVVPASFVYGFDIGKFLDLNPNTIDEQNFFKAIMGLYLGFSVLWLLGIFKTKYLKPALLTNLIFMLGLASGRLISIIIDGVPTPAYILGTIGEFILGFYGLWVLITQHQSSADS